MNKTEKCINLENSWKPIYRMQIYDSILSRAAENRTLLTELLLQMNEWMKNYILLLN